MAYDSNGQYFSPEAQAMQRAQALSASYRTPQAIQQGMANAQAQQQQYARSGDPTGNGWNFAYTNPNLYNAQMANFAATGNQGAVNGQGSGMGNYGGSLTNTPGNGGVSGWQQYNAQNPGTAGSYSPYGGAAGSGLAGSAGNALRSMLMNSQQYNPNGANTYGIQNMDLSGQGNYVGQNGQAMPGSGYNQTAQGTGQVTGQPLPKATAQYF